MRTVRWLLAALSFFATPLAATTIVVGPDEWMVDGSEVVVVGTVAERSAVLDEGRIFTDYRLAVERPLKGDVRAGEALPVRIPGGEAAGFLRKVWGAPEFAVGDRVLLFLGRHTDGTWRTFQLVQGHFQAATVGERRLWVRDLSEVNVLGTNEDAAETALGRDADGFADWIADRAAGLRRPADYRVAVAPGELRAALAKFTYLGDEPARWYEFERGINVGWRADESGHAGIVGSGFAEFQTALNAWNSDPATDIRYRYNGTTSSRAGFREDRANTIYFDDYRNDVQETFTCRGAGDGFGTLAVGGFLALSAPIPHPIVEADIIINDGTGCWFNGINRRAEHVYAHELGHTLGLGHSCGEGPADPCDTPAKDDALMRATAHTDRGAVLGDDDRAGILSLYRQAPAPAERPAAPSGLTATAVSPSEIRLAWQDNSDNETGFRVERRTGTGGFQDIQLLPANSVSATVSGSGLSPGTSYGFRVRARNGAGFSPYSNVASATTPAALPAAPSHLVARPVEGSRIELSWRDESSDETGFEVEQSSPDAAFFRLAPTFSPDTTVLATAVLAADTPYTFRVRAVGPGGPSAWSNLASATTEGPAGPCVASADTLCLGGGRFRVNVAWRIPTGEHGAGKAVPSSSQTGLFWFFDASNVELIVKVLDGTGANGFYWTFFGGLSDVAYWITAVDTETGESKTYHNPQGNYCGTADTESLPTTGSASARAFALPALAPPPALPAAAKGTCTPSAHALCLAGGRFRVEVDFKRPLPSGPPLEPANAVPLAGTDRTGLFWFFDATNLELVAKVIDGQAQNGKQWFFYGALSDVQYRVRVTDTETGAQKVYENPAGNFCGRADTAAF